MFDAAWDKLREYWSGSFTKFIHSFRSFNFEMVYWKILKKIRDTDTFTIEVITLFSLCFSIYLCFRYKLFRSFVLHVQFTFMSFHLNWMLPIVFLIFSCFFFFLSTLELSLFYRFRSISFVYFCFTMYACVLVIFSFFCFIYFFFFFYSLANFQYHSKLLHWTQKKKKIHAHCNLGVINP